MNMELEQSESFFVEGLFRKSIERKKIEANKVDFIVKLTGDASTRRYYRVESGIKSYVVCIDAPQCTSVSPSPFVEIQQVLKDNGVRVPAVLDMDYKKGYILEEDLGDKTFLIDLAGIESTKEENDKYTPCIEELLKIHRIDVRKYSDVQFSKLAFDEEKLMSEVLFTIKFFIRSFMNCNLTPANESILVSGFLKICQEVARVDRVLTHRDYHSRNIMVKEEELIVIDFQDARMGLPQYDLVSLLEDCYYDIDRENILKLRKYYWDNQEKKMKKGGLEAFERLYDLTSVQRIFKAIGSFSYIYAGREDQRYVKYIGHGLERIKRILFNYPEYKDLRVCLSRAYYEN